MAESENFLIEWCIENFKACPLHKICTPRFYVGLLRETRWRLILYPKGYTVPKKTAFYLQRVQDDDGIDEIFVDFELAIRSQISQQISHSFKNIRFSVNDVSGYAEFLQYPPTARIVFICILRESDSENNNRSSKKDTELLSIQLHNIFFDDYFPDFLLVCEDREFDVHKAILAARCPKFWAYLESETHIGLPGMVDMSNIISADSLSLLLSYIYSGKLDSTANEIPSNLYTVAIRFEMADLCQIMKSFPYSCTVRTKFEAQRHHLTWQVDKKHFFKPLVRVIRAGTYSFRSLIISFSVRKNDRGRETITLEFELKGFKSNVCIDVTTIVRNTKKKHFIKISDIHLFTEGEKWALCSNAPISEILPKKFILDINVEIFDGKNSSTVENFISDKLLFWNFTQLPNDMMQLLQEESYSDFILETENEETFSVHRAILAYRCPMFYIMLTTNMGENMSGRAKIEWTSASIMESVVSYLYSGTLKELTFDDCVDVYEISDRFLLDGLREKCSSLLPLFEDKDITLIGHLAELFGDEYLSVTLKSA
ncbi:protein roadkill [Trichonephila inaurata madagascariensis]|uniref:Protein roadkill n=1 Tax=Trichonephila inaurata madagascariensis TaxID=2747483 RepID=A0A8X7BR84_9ARAC|nr:protein roadkill [Trichonephila inaurata madagascariensis]